MWKRMLLAMFAFIAVSACKSRDSDDVRLVKSVNLAACPTATVEKMVNSYMGNPRWSSGVTADRKSFVNIEGSVKVHGKEVNAMLQFSVDKENGGVSFNALEFNSVPQIKLMAFGMLSNMCKSASSMADHGAQSDMSRVQGGQERVGFKPQQLEAGVCQNAVAEANARFAGVVFDGRPDQLKMANVFVACNSVLSCVQKCKGNEKKCEEVMPYGCTLNFCSEFVETYKRNFLN